MPVVLQNPPPTELTDERFASLEKLGGVALSAQHRQDLFALANFWVNDSLVQKSSRPRDFRIILDDMIGAIDRAGATVRINERGATEVQRHFLVWAMNTPEGGPNFVSALDSLDVQLSEIRKTAVRLKDSLPADPGRKRPFQDYRRISMLADIFEAAGGKPTVYATEHEEGGFADTALRRFARQFYSYLPLAVRRTSSGLDNALREALSIRRRSQKPSDLP